MISCCVEGRGFTSCLLYLVTFVRFFRCVIECREDYKYNEEAIECLIKQGLINLSQYDLALATSMENGQNYMAVTLAMQLVKKLIVSASAGKGANFITESDLANTIETLVKISSQGRTAAEGLVSI